MLISGVSEDCHEKDSAVSCIRIIFQDVHKKEYMMMMTMMMMMKMMMTTTMMMIIRERNRKTELSTECSAMGL
eukprot:205138-Karenia_brevis.AAC.1